VRFSWRPVVFVPLVVDTVLHTLSPCLSSNVQKSSLLALSSSVYLCLNIPTLFSMLYDVSAWQEPLRKLPHSP
jgi:hypothetical protein